MFWFCVELLLYPKFFNNGLTLQAPSYLTIVINSFQVGADKMFRPKCIWPDAKDIATSSV